MCQTFLTHPSAAGYEGLFGSGDGLLYSVKQGFYQRTEAIVVVMADLTLGFQGDAIRRFPVVGSLTGGHRFSLWLVSGLISELRSSS